MFIPWRSGFREIPQSAPRGRGPRAGRGGPPGLREEARGARARGAEGRREQAGQKAHEPASGWLWVLGTSKTALPCQPGARAERHTGCTESRLPSLSL